MATFIPSRFDSPVTGGTRPSDRTQDDTPDYGVLTAPHNRGIRIPHVSELHRDPASVPARHKLVILQNPSPGSKLWENTKDSFDSAGSIHFQVGDGEMLVIPTISSNKQWTPALGVRMSIHGRRLNLSIRATISIHHEVDAHKVCVYKATID